MLLPLLASLLVTQDDFASLVGLDSPAIAANAKTAAVVVKTVAWEADKRTNDLVIVDLQSGAQRTLLTNRPGLSSPAFSPDGTQLAFLADDSASKNSHTRVFVMPVSEGSARPVSPSDVDAAEFAWRPDGQAIAYAAADPEPEKSGAERFRDSFVFTTEPITAREFPEPIHLFIAQLGAENTAQLTFGPASIVDGSPLSWSPDGAAIAVTLSRNAILNDQSYSWAAIV
ncbi:MAG: PD40 domain-containing protein, partial [Candidatus Eremiobacteraeota bacterium]|nr:PD40 domain-containing protein [Candidatus Eremiobacteraeota bacterium]